MDDSVSIDASPLFVPYTSPRVRDLRKQTRTLLLSVSPSVAAACSSRSTTTTIYSASPLDHTNAPLSPATFLSARATMEQITSPEAPPAVSQQARWEKRLLFYRDELNRMGMPVGSVTAPNLCSMVSVIMSILQCGGWVFFFLVLLF
jgi:hypothetical protein